jgi:hypothetical protein
MQSTHVQKRNYVFHNRSKHKSGKNIALKPEHAINYNDRHTIRTLQASPPVNENVFTNGSTFKFILEENSMKTIKNMVWRFQITEQGTGGTVLAPTGNWFNRIEIYDRHTGNELARYYGDNLYWSASLLDQQDIKRLTPYLNLDGSVTQLVSTSRYYYLPMVAFWSDNFDLDMSSLNHELEFRFHPKTGIVSSGSADIILNDLSLVAEELQLNENSRMENKQFMTRHVKAHNYLTPQQYIKTGQTMNANTKYTFNLDTFHHKSAMLQFCIRVADNNLNGDALDYQDLSDGLIDLVSQSGESLYGNGSAVVADYCKDVIGSRQFNNDFYDTNNVYSIFFCEDVGSAFSGMIDGYYSFKGQKDQLEITTPATWTNGVYEVVIYSYYYKRVEQHNGTLRDLVLKE